MVVVTAEPAVPIDDIYLQNEHRTHCYSTRVPAQTHSHNTQLQIYQLHE